MKKLVAGFLALFLCLTGCGSRSAEYTLPIPEEKRLVIYTSHKEAVYGPIIKEFEERTGLWAEVVTGGTNELLERISAEAEDPNCDVMFGGGVESLAACEELFSPYFDADTAALKEGIGSAEHLWVPFSSLPIVLIYNQKLVGAGEATGWSDLLDPKWKGKIALADPTISGSSYTAVLTMIRCLSGDAWTLLERLVTNLDGKILSDSGDVVSEVANGNLPLGVTLEESALKSIAEGADLAILYPEEGTSAVPDGSALILNAPHRANAQKFLEFVQSKDTQELVVRALSRRPVRTDVAAPENLPPEESLRLIAYDVHWAAALKEEFTQKWVALTKEAAH